MILFYSRCFTDRTMSLSLTLSSAGPPGMLQSPFMQCPRHLEELIPTELGKEEPGKAATCFRLRLVNQLHQLSHYSPVTQLLWHFYNKIKMQLHACARTTSTVPQPLHLLTALMFWSLSALFHIKITEPFAHLASWTGIPGAWYIWRKHRSGHTQVEKWKIK